MPAAKVLAGSYEGTHAGQARERGNLGHGSRNFEIKERSSHALLGPVTGILVTCVSTRATVCADRYTACYDNSIEFAAIDTRRCAAQFGFTATALTGSDDVTASNSEADHLSASSATGFRVNTREARRRGLSQLARSHNMGCVSLVLGHGHHVEAERLAIFAGRDSTWDPCR